MARRDGFTLIELLIVVVIIGILAAVAIPQFSATREKAYFAAMKADLRNLQAQQEIYYGGIDPSTGHSRFVYANSKNEPELGFAESQGVTVTIDPASNSLGWSATATHQGLGHDPARSCAVFVGKASPVGAATVPDVVACQGER